MGCDVTWLKMKEVEKKNKSHAQGFKTGNSRGVNNEYRIWKREMAFGELSRVEMYKIKRVK